MSWISVMFQALQLMTTCFVIIKCRTCSTGWFGSECQYKCHCQDMKCSDTGECIGTSCERGWFDYLCQYQNVMELPKTSVTGIPSDMPLDWLTDNSDSTCNNNPGLQSVTVTFESHLVFTWLHLTVKEGETAEGITLKFEPSKKMGKMIDCHNREFMATKKSVRTFEVGCDIFDPVAKVILSGSQLNNLCALQINGGRNVALKQNTSYDQLSNRVFPGTSLRAVDGNTSANFDTCAKPVPSWTLTFRNDFTITRILLYNIRDFEARTQYFELAGYGFGYDGSTALFQHDYTMVKEPIVEVLNRAWKQPWRVLSIIAKSETEAMTLCEVETFGDCPPKTGGLECDRCEGRCIRDTCFRDGICKEGCHGKAIPPLCLQECRPNTWGLNCDKTCVGCYNASCDQLSGLCTQGCNGYSDPPDCTRECTPGTWGRDCNSSCSVHCKYASCNREKGFCDQGCANGLYGDDCSLTCPAKCQDGECDSVNGHCLQCLPGYQGKFCDEGCTDGFYGDNCSSPCSVGCKDGPCDPVQGHCRQCFPGYQGTFCDEECTPGTWGEDCTSSCSRNCSGTTCYPQTGFCDQGCIKGFYGKDCSLTCPEKCRDGQCNHEDRTCLRCRPGYQGTFCDEECTPGTWGEDCKSSCSSNCSGTSCYPQTGFCDQGCIKGFYGDKCSLACPEKCKDGQCHRVNRTCLRCHPGNHGPYCDKATTMLQELLQEILNLDKIAIFCIGLSVGLICVLLPLSVYCLCSMMRRKKTKKCPDNCGVEDAL